MYRVTNQIKKQSQIFHTPTHYIQEKNPAFYVAGHPPAAVNSHSFFLLKRERPRVCISPLRYRTPQCVFSRNGLVINTLKKYLNTNVRLHIEPNLDTKTTR